MKRKILFSCYVICMLLMSVILVWRASSGYVFAYEYNSMNGKENASGIEIGTTSLPADLVEQIRRAIRVGYAIVIDKEKEN